ncbi:MAG: SDR family oxidoreductase [Pseudomonadota bacterium]
MTSTLDGKTAIVTGASRGIGAAAARQLAAEGVSVLLAARTSSEIEEVAQDIRNQGGTAQTVTCDVSSYPQVAAMVARCKQDFGRVDILVNNAGLIDPIARLGDADPDEWAKVADVNYKGVFFGLRAALPEMAAQGSGTIINISSGAAYGPMEGWSHYCSSKAAAAMLTRCADKEYADKGIRVVGLSPGTVATDMQVSIKASGINPVSQLDPSVHIPADWVGKAIVWLCTDGAEEFAGQDFSLKSDEGRARVGLPGI